MQLKLLSVDQEFAKIEKIWLALQAQTPHSYFLSWGLMAFWLKFVRQKVALKCAVIESDGVPVACAIVHRTSSIRNHIIWSRSLTLNAVGSDEFDALLWIEYNKMLGETNIQAVFSQFLEAYPNGWDELFIPGLDAQSELGKQLLAQSFKGLQFYDEQVIPAYFVDLKQVRDNQNNLIPILKSSTRSQIRRSYKLYRERGEISLECANSVDRAIEIFNELMTLHQKSFMGRQRTSHFASEQTQDFHHQLIRERFDYGEIQMLRIGYGEEVIGCLYNFVFQGRVYFFQSGMCYEKDNRLKPGYMCHVEAIQFNAAQGHAMYDFLAGTERFKVSLSNGQHNNMIWGRLQKPRLQFGLERWLKNKVREHRARKAKNK